MTKTQDDDNNPVLEAGDLRILAVDEEARLYIGPRPREDGATEQVAQAALRGLIKVAHITAIVDLNADRTEKRLVEGRGLTYRGIYVKDDGNALSPAVMKSASQAVEELLASGHRVYLHCKFGKGRSPTVAAAYLIAYQGMSTSAARARIEELDSKWLHRGIWSGYDARFPGRLLDFERRVRREQGGQDTD